MAPVGGLGARRPRRPAARTAPPTPARSPRAGRPPRTTPPTRSRWPAPADDADASAATARPPPSEMRSSRDMSRGHFWRLAVGCAAQSAVTTRKGPNVGDFEVGIPARRLVELVWYLSRCRRYPQVGARGSGRSTLGFLFGSRSRRRHRQSTDNLPARPTLRPSRPPAPPAKPTYLAPPTHPVGPAAAAAASPRATSRNFTCGREAVTMSGWGPVEQHPPPARAHARVHGAHGCRSPSSR